MSFTTRTPPRLLMRVWDAPTRLCHWAIVVLIVTSYVTVKLDWIELHLLSGYSMLTLLLFRLAWGFVGSDTSRFGKFLKSPAAGWRYLQRFSTREADTEIGHNAAGGWIVLLLLLLLATQIGTGLFSRNDVDAHGPLAGLVSKAASSRITGLHAWNWTVLLIASGLHVVSIAAYALVKGQDLVRPMLTGRKRLPAHFRQPRMASPLLAALLLALAGMLVWLFVTWV